ncbi:MAG: DUF485 domain-containing protein [Chthoniobacterales bacterium]|nr:DUF485 domain-containing protein [Chthoniobacterales bacterium]
MSSPDTPTNRDYTAIVGSQTDIAPLGRTGRKPDHELTAEEDGGRPLWTSIAADPGFAELRRSKLRLIVPATIFFVVYYFLLPVGVGWFPSLMEKKIWGDMNIAYFYALSQFFMAWILAGIYVAAAARWDKSEHELLSKYGAQHR